MIDWINRMLDRKQPTLDQKAETQAIELDRDILNQELDMITMKFKIAEYRARQEHLQQWLAKRVHKPNTPVHIVMQAYDATQDGM
jgi:hypothetical protein